MANITGDTTDNTLNGTTGDDTINDGNGGNDTLNGDAGNDKLTVTGGNDTVHGGGGDTDTLIMQWGGTTTGVYSSSGPYGTGADISGSYTDGVSYSVSYDGIERLQITTGSGNDTLYGGGLNDVIKSGAGDDIVNVISGNDTADGGAGSDGISADLGGATGAISWNVNANTFSSASGYGSFTNFEYFGTISTGSGAYNDTIVTATGAHSEIVSTGDGDDSVTVSGGGDTVHMGLGTDTLTIDYSASTTGLFVTSGYYADANGGVYGGIYDGASSSVSFDSVEKFHITGGSGNDALIGWSMDDILNSGSGDDTVNAGSGNDTADGGAGSDGISADLTGATGAISWDVNANTFSSASNYGSFTNFEYFGTVYTGTGDYDDTIVTAHGTYNETVYTGDGDDNVSVSGGGDNVHMGLGTDTLTIDYSASTTGVFVTSGYYADANGGVYGGIYDGASSSVSFDSVEQFHITSGSGNDALVGWSMDDVLNSGSGDDMVSVGAGNDSADGGDGTDGISADLSGATAGSNWNLQANTYDNADDFGSFANFEYFGTVTGSAHDDTFVSTSLSKSETVAGGDGDDTFTTVNGSDNFNGNDGNDRLVVDWRTATGTSYVSSGLYYNADLSFYGSYSNSDGRSISFDGLENVTFLGSEQADSINSSGGDDVFSMGGGDDSAFVGAGTNIVDGGSGIDQLSIDYSGAAEGIDLDLSLTGEQLAAGPGSVQNIEWLSTLTGSGFGDTVVTSSVARNDSINTGAGDDTVTLVNGQDTVNLSDGNDRLVVDWSAATGTSSVSSGLYYNGVGSFYGSYSNSDGRSVSFDGVENVTFIGSAQADSISASAGDDVFSMGGGNDNANVGAGTNTVDGGDGIDQLGIDYSGASEAIDLDLTRTGEQLAAGPGSIQNIEWVSTLTGSNFADSVVTGTGALNDVVNTGDGDDRVTVHNGQDNVGLGAADDTLVVDWSDSAGNSSISSGFYSSGGDTFYGSLSNSDGRSVSFDGAEHLVFEGGSGIDNIHGWSSSDTLIGGGAPDTLSGFGGNDLIQGGSGEDALDGGQGIDTVSFADQAGAVSVELAAGSATDAGGLNDSLMGFENVIGSSFDDTIMGDVGTNVIDGGAGYDDMSGLWGSDVYYVDGAGDVIRENSGQGLDRAYVSVSSYTLADNVEDMQFQGTGDFTGSGNASKNLIAAGTGNDTLTGLGDKDTLIGDAGSDTLLGGDGSDTLLGGVLGDNLVVNGSFETQDGSNTSYEYVQQAPGGVVNGVEWRRGQVYGWTTETIGGAAAEVEFNHAVTNVNFSTGDGYVAIDMTTNGSDNMISQDVAGVNAGENYLLSFTAALPTGQNAGDSTDATLEVYWNGVLVGTVNPTTNDPEHHAFLVPGVAVGTGAGGLNQITFREVGSTADSRGTILDDVQLRSIADTDSAGNDHLDGGTGGDDMIGGLGNDHYTVDDAGDVVFENAGEGTDEVLTDLASYTLGDNLEKLTGTAAVNQTLTGNTLDNFIFGSTANDTLSGLEGNDHLDGGAGADTMIGGTGNDVFVVDDAGDVVTENSGEGTDEVRTNLAAYTLAANVENLTGFGDSQALTGNARANTIRGTAGTDTLDGGAGADTLFGGRGDDTYVVDSTGDAVKEYAGGGTDNVQTGLASYRLTGNVENLTGTSATGQRLIGNDLANAINGGAGNDTLDGGTGADSLVGGAGDDRYIVDSAGDVVTEGSGGGTDEVYTSLASYTLGANLENLKGTGSGQALTGNDHANTIRGSAGNDALDGGAGADTLYGGAGDDSYIVDNAGDVVKEFAGGGTDSVQTDLASYRLTGNVENLTGTAAGGQRLVGNDLANTIDGGSGNDTLDGGAGADTLAGGAGDDRYIVDNAADVVTEGSSAGTDEVFTSLAAYTLGDNLENLDGTGTGQALTGNGLANTIRGTAGNDTLDGGAGADTMFGGAGNDIYVVDSTGDVVKEYAGGGTDEVQTSLAFYQLGATVENLTGTSAGGQRLVGNDGANAIKGGAGNDTLDGGSGADTLAGGAGDDRYIVDNAGDVVTEGAGAGTDEVFTALASYTLTANVENLEGTGTGQALTGNGLANTIRGTAGNDTLDGGAGADTLFGGSGDDTYVVDNAGDAVNESVGAGTDTVRTTLASYALADNVENLVGTSASAQALTGNAQANTSTGGSGNDTLDGGAGADTLTGGAGSDRYVVDNAGDVVVEVSGQGLDSVSTSLASYTLAANVENLVGTAATGQALTGNNLKNTVTGGNGDDALDGGANADHLSGGLGNDHYVVDNAGDVVTEGANHGIDEVFTNLAAYTLASNVENLKGTSAAGQALTGNDLANELRGNVGNDTLDGGAGADTLYGGAGDDTYVVDNAGDVVKEFAASGSDSVLTSLAAYQLTGNVENLTGTVDTGQSLTGNGLANTLTGAGGNDTLTGGDGQDFLFGGGGADVFAFANTDSSADHALADVIGDFDSGAGDKIDLALIDARTTNQGDQAFDFIGTDAFSGAAGELHYLQDGGNTFVEGDVDGDGTADFSIQVTGLHDFVATDFVL
jgi:Ca2+-binding RTX toxin-like protein